MLKIVRSNYSYSARDAFCKEIVSLTERGVRVCYIVPEQQTVMTEGLMARILPPSAALTLEVTNFTRLANTTFRALGGLSGEYCDSVKKSLIMWRTMTELAPTLSMTSGRKEISAPLVSNALTSVEEMQNLGINPTLLIESAESDQVKSDKRLVGKLRDLSSIYSLYKQLLSEKYADVGDDADAMIKKLEQNPLFLKDTVIYVEGFTSFTEPQYRLIGLLSERSSVSVALTLPKGREEAFEFTELAECQRRLVSSARKRGAEIKLSREDSNGARSPEGMSEICSYLWSTIKPNDNITLQNPNSLRIFEAKNPYEECEFICNDIKRRVMDGASYSDFAIVARGTDRFSGILNTALDRAEIPSFNSYRRDISEFEAIKLIYTAYAVGRGFAREDVISYLKCGFTGIDRSLCDEFEGYINKWQISGKRFTDSEPWSMNPLGYTVTRNELTEAKLVRINEVRDRVIKPIHSFSHHSLSAKTVREQAEVLLNFLLEIDLEGSLKARSRMLQSMGEDTLAQENSGLWRSICAALDSLVEVLGDSPADAETFLSQLKIVFSSMDIGRIPAYSDIVTVGSADLLRLYEKPHIYLIGVNAGVFPGAVSEGSYFSERDRQRLSESGLSITPELEIKGARELYFFTRAFSYATDSVTLTYSAADTKLKPIEPAEVIGRIRQLSGICPVKISSLASVDRIYTPAAALEHMGDLGDDYSAVREALNESGYSDVVTTAEGDITNSSASLGKNIVDGMRCRAISLSQTRIDAFVNCPFGYFCRHTIGLKPEERAEFDARGIGSFIHAILENFFRALSDGGRKSAELDRQEREALTRRAAEKYIGELGEDLVNSSQRTMIKIDRLCRAALPVVDGLCDEFSASAFEPRFFEFSIGRGEDSPAPLSISSDGGRVNIYGIIDRVDSYKRGEDVYLRVIDYKTGHKEFSPEDMSEGANLQMFLYLKSLLETENENFRQRLNVGEGGRVLPAGVIYVRTSVGDVRVDTPDDRVAEEAVKAAQHREGMILDDEEIIAAMNIKYTPLYSARTPDKIPESKRKYLFSEDGFGDIMQTVESAVIKVSDGIRSGNMPATPKWQKNGKSSCEYCEFKPICRKVEK